MIDRARGRDRDLDSKRMRNKKTDREADRDQRGIDNKTTSDLNLR